MTRHARTEAIDLDAPRSCAAYWEFRNPLSHTTSDLELKRLYRQMCAKEHPDVSKRPDAHARFIVLGVAYDDAKAAKQWERDAEEEARRAQARREQEQQREEQRRRERQSEYEAHMAWIMAQKLPAAQVPNTGYWMDDEGDIIAFTVRGVVAWDDTIVVTGATQTRKGWKFVEFDASTRLRKI